MFSEEVQREYVSSSSEDSIDTIVDRNLSIENYKTIIIETVRLNQFVIINGKTGCGKTVKIPQYLLEAGINKKCLIGITQPRRIAAVSNSKRVAREMNCDLGEKVGYQVRFDKKVNASTKIKFMTEGILFNEFQADRRLNDYGVIMIDEVHERSVNTDLILGIVKHVTFHRPDIRIIVTSATMNTVKFSAYFNNAKIISIQGTSFPVDIFYRELRPRDAYIDNTITIIKEIISQNKLGDILVFLPGEDAIISCYRNLGNIPNLVLLPLYAALGPKARKKIFKPVEPLKRKVVLATDMAESSITIDGIKFVIDCGYFKQHDFCANFEIDELNEVNISKAQAEQRSGRAGRTQSGWCYRLYTKEWLEFFNDEIKPEIHRKNLSEMYLKLLSMEFDPFTFDFLDKPEKDELLRSETELIEMRLINEEKKMTNLGKLVARLPIDIMLGKWIATSIRSLCFMDILRISACLSQIYIFIRPIKEEEEGIALYKQKTFYDKDGDHFTFLNVYKEWRKSKHCKRWCHDYFIHAHTMKEINMIIAQFLGLLKKNNISFVSTNTIDKSQIKQSFISVFYKNITVYSSFLSDIYAFIRCHKNMIIYNFKNSSLKVQELDRFTVIYYKGLRSQQSYMHNILQLDECDLKPFEKELQTINFYGIERRFLSFYMKLFWLNDWWNLDFYDHWDFMDFNDYYHLDFF